MRIVILSDIHGNLEALRSITDSWDEVWVLDYPIDTTVAHQSQQSLKGGRSLRRNTCVVSKRSGSTSQPTDLCDRT